MESKKFQNLLVAEVRQLIDSNAVNAVADKNNFIAFLHYCAEQLNKGEPVQVIWNDYQGRAG